MTNTGSAADCLERARMHDRLADATQDADARAVHRALAAEFRRKANASDGFGAELPTAKNPIIELSAVIR